MCVLNAMDSIAVYTVEFACVCVCRSGLVESKIRILVSKLEFNDGIELAHVYPTSYGPPPGEKYVCCIYVICGILHHIIHTDIIRIPPFSVIR